MKRLLFASLVAVAATTLQAVNYDWTAVSTGGAATGQVTLENGLSHTKGFAVSLTINVTQVPDTITGDWWPAILSLSTSEHPTANITANMAGDNVIRLDTKNGNGATQSTQIMVPSNTALTTGEHTIVLAYDGKKMTLTLDGTELVSTDYTLDYDPNLVAWGQQAGYPNQTELNKGGHFEYTIESLEVGEVQTIPEPTALALLALGVAGVALRRRVA